MNILNQKFPPLPSSNWNKNRPRRAVQYTVGTRPETFNEWVELMQPAYDAIKGTNVQDKLIDQELGI